jgi:hypothetical protein
MTHAAAEYRPRATTTRVIVHISQQFASVHNVAAILRTKGRAMGLLDVGYHYVIERDGRVVCTRHWAVMGSHTPGNNHDSIGVYIVGGGNGGSTMNSLQSLWHNTFGPGLALVTRQEALKSQQLPEGDDLRFIIQGAPYKVEAEKHPTQFRSYTPQQQALVEFLESGRTITNLIAITTLGIGSLSSRIAELKVLNYPIHSERGEDIHGKPYSKYSKANAGGLLLMSATPEDGQIDNTYFKPHELP